MMVNHQSFLMDDKLKRMEYKMALQKRPKPGTTSPIKKPGKPTRPGDSINKPNDPIKKLPKVPGSQLDQIRQQIEERNKKDGKYVDSLYNTYPM
jgi:hypothetical protein